MSGPCGRTLHCTILLLRYKGKDHLFQNNLICTNNFCSLVVLSVSLCVSNHWNNIHRSGKRNDHRARKGALYTKYIVAVFKYIVAVISYNNVIVKIKALLSSK